MKVVIDMQLVKLDLKMSSIDEYDKFISHQMELLKVYQHQMLANEIQNQS